MNSTELLEQFILEARECLECIGQRLLDVEKSPDDTELLNDLFRQIHDLVKVNPRRVTHFVQYRDKNFQLGISGSGAKPPDRAVHYFGAGFDSRQSVPNGKA